MSLLAFPSVSDTYLTVSFLALMKQKIVATSITLPLFLGTQKIPFFKIWILANWSRDKITTTDWPVKNLVYELMSIC